MEVVCRHISANCNPMPNVVAFLDQDTVVFAFSNNIALYSLAKDQIQLTIFGTPSPIQTMSNSINEPIASPSSLKSS